MKDACCLLMLMLLQLLSCSAVSAYLLRLAWEDYAWVESIEAWCCEKQIGLN